MTEPGSAATLSDRQALLAAAGSGTILWLATMVISGRHEAWDSPLYWTVTYPLAIVAAGVLGYLAPHRAWLWALTLMLVQALVVAIAASSFMLLPLGLILFAFMAVPPIVAALIASWFGRRRRHSEDTLSSTIDNEQQTR